MSRFRTPALAASLLAVVTLGGLASPAQADDATATITASGTIRDSDGRPVAGLSVVSRSGSAETVTAADGSYTVPVTSDFLGPDRFAVCYSGGWGRTTRDADRVFSSDCAFLDASAAGTTVRQDFTATRNGRFSGTVTDFEGRPVAGVQVEACRFSTVDPADMEGGISIYATTDARGRYSVAVPAGFVTFEWSKAGYVTDRFDTTGSCTGEREYTDDVSTVGSEDRTGVDRVLTRAGDTVKVKHRPYVAGTPNVGWKLTARPGTYDPKDATVSYRWSDGTDTPDGENGDIGSFSYDPTFVPSADLEGRHLYLDVTASLKGKVSTTTRVDVGVIRTPRRPATAITSVHRPYAVGTARVAWTLSARPGTWSVEPTKVTYRWTIAGKTVSTTSTFKPRAAQRGASISLTATASRPGWTSASRTVPAGVVK